VSPTSWALAPIPSTTSNAARGRGLRPTRRGMAVDLLKTDCPARAAAWAEHVEPGHPRDQSGPDRRRPRGELLVPGSTTPFASARAAASATCRLAAIAMSRPRTPIAAVSAESRQQSSRCGGYHRPSRNRCIAGLSRFADYLANINRSAPTSAEFSLKTTARPTGRATRVILTEYKLPRPDLTEPHDVRCAALPSKAPSGPNRIDQFPDRIDDGASD
jgi:hypothetical protein